MTCRKMESNIADMLFDPDRVSAAVKTHVAECADCSRELAELQATMRVMDAWEAPEPTPYFDTRLQARLREEKAAPPAGWLEQLKARLLFNSRAHLHPIAATALTVLMAVGGATYVGLVGHNHPQPQQTSATVRDLQSLDNNQQVFQQLDSLDQDDDDPSAN
jgi:hypothetical protein